MTAKAECRARLKALREGLPASERARWSAAICQHLDAFCRDHDITRIAAFWPFGSEVDLRAAMSQRPEALWYFSRVISVHPPRLAWGLAPLAAGRWGLQEPVSAPHAEPPVELLLVPGLAFNDQGFRIGYGRGFYDEVLAQAHATVRTVAIGFECQLHQQIPVEPHDQPVQRLLSEVGFQSLTNAG